MPGKLTPSGLLQRGLRRSDMTRGESRTHRLPGVCLILLTMGVCACTHEAVYNDLQRNQRLKCAETTTTQAAYEKCIEPAEQSYRDYVREREESMAD